jgi:hypothetical protein
MNKWLSESVDDQPYNAIAAVKLEQSVNKCQTTKSDPLSETLANDEK